MTTIYDKSSPGRRGADLDRPDVPLKLAAADRIPNQLRRAKPAGLPEVAEVDAVRHFVNLSRKNFGVDIGFYPLGSCTMKYSPKITEAIASLPGFTRLHPLLPQLEGGAGLVQGALKVIYKLEQLLCEITGMSAFSLQPMAGAHGELTGIMIMAAYHKDKGNDKEFILIPDSAHGTNPASAAAFGYKVVTIPSKDGTMDPEAFEAALKEMGDKVAGVMMTNPNTVGLFNPHVLRIAADAHEVDALMYYDGANLNAIMGYARPADLGFDIVHLNLHKTFSTPHGMGGPGAGPVGVVEELAGYLPVGRVVERSDQTLALDYNYPKSIGYIAPFYGNFGVCLKAYAYIVGLGGEGLKRVSENAVLNANYLRVRLKDTWKIAHDKPCMHEVVFTSSDKAEKYGVHTVDVAKALIDAGFHPPTVYFPLVVPEALMIEPTETESKETLDAFVEAMNQIAKKAAEDPESLHAAPKTTPVGRLDEVSAARNLDLIQAED